MLGIGARKIVTPGYRVKASQVGGKFDRQNRMLLAGLNVPPFFCLTAALYETIFTPLASTISGILKTIDFDQPAALNSGSAEIRNLFAAVQLPDRDQQSILRTLDRLSPNGDLVSVRASMIGLDANDSEDSSRNPFAGMSESFLYVRRQDIIEKILLCAASGFSSESMLYRYKQSIDLMRFSVAVGVQQMIPGVRSFVLFTCNPTTAARETVIIAGHGIGEGVVQEKVAVDHFFFNPMSAEIRRQVVEKEDMLTVGPEGYGITSMKVPAELRLLPCLSDDEVKRLSAIGSQIERLFKCPQDIEGTLTADGTVHILQSRPIVIESQRQRVWSNANITESFADVTTPLTYSHARHFYRVVFHDCYRRLGIRAGDLHGRQELLDRMIGFLGGRVYYNLTSIYRLHGQSPLFPLFRAHWERLVGFQASYEIRDETPSAVQHAAVFVRFGAALIRIIWTLTTNNRDIRRFHAWWDHLIAPRRGRTYAQDDALLVSTDFHEVWSQVGRRWGSTLMNDVYLGVLHGWMEALFRRWKLGESLMNKLLCGDETVVSVEIVLSAIRLAEYVRSDAPLLKLFREHTPEELALMMQAGQLPAEFSALVKSHLHFYGDRGFYELRMEQLNLRDTPWLLLRIVQSYVHDGLTADMYRAKERGIRAEAEKELDQICRSHPARKTLIRVGVRTLRQFIRNRENARYSRSELFSYSKNVFRGIASSLVRGGHLRDVDEIYYLTQDEIFGFIDGTGVTENLRSLVDIRRSEFLENQKRRVPMEMTTWGPLRQNDIFAVTEGVRGSNVLRGLGSSSGKVRGTARIVLDANQHTDLGVDAILIARETDPGWLFLMLSAKALVVERGSMLSHTAITGRKFCIPTVVAVPEATMRIPDGAQIEVDGGLGVVTILGAVATDQ
jgi:pyruvate,water dikinase